MYYITTSRVDRKHIIIQSTGSAIPATFRIRITLRYHTEARIYDSSLARCVVVEIPNICVIIQTNNTASDGTTFIKQNTFNAYHIIYAIRCNDLCVRVVCVCVFVHVYTCVIVVCAHYESHETTPKPCWLLWFVCSLAGCARNTYVNSADFTFRDTHKHTNTRTNTHIHASEWQPLWLTFSPCVVHAMLTRALTCRNAYASGAHNYAVSNTLPLACERAC